MTIQVLRDNSAGDPGPGTVRTGPVQDVGARARALAMKMNEGPPPDAVATDATVTETPQRAANGRFQPQQAAAEEAEEVIEGDAADGELTEGDPSETPTKPDGKKPATAKLDKLESRIREERKLRKSDVGMKQLRAERQALDAQRQQVLQERARLDQHLNGLRQGDPGLLRALLDQIGPDAVSNFLLEEANPERKAERLRMRASAPQPRGQQEPDVMREIQELRAQVQQYVGADQQKQGEHAFQTRVGAVAEDAPLTAALMKASPKMLMQRAHAAFNDLHAEQKQGRISAFDDDDIILAIESELKTLSALGAPKTPRRPEENEDDASPANRSRPLRRQVEAPTNTKDDPAIRRLDDTRSKGLENRVKNVKARFAAAIRSR